MKQWIKLTVPVVAMAVAGLSAQAAQIVGGISFTGNVTLNTGDAGTATAVTGWTGVAGVGLPVVQSSSGNFMATAPAGSMATFATPWVFNSTSDIPVFWTVGGFTFDLQNSHITAQNVTTGSGLNINEGAVTVTGAGFISGNGFDSTLGSWSFSTQDPAVGTDTGTGAATFSFSASTGAIPPAVPDGGMTVMMLGAALTGLSLIKRKIA